MIPPLLLDARAGQKVLDMCAAPGSKTIQILELMSDDGVLIANDMDAKRAYMLANRCKRLNSCTYTVTTHQVCFLIFFVVGKKKRENEEDTWRNDVEKEKQHLYNDRPKSSPVCESV